MYALLTNLSSLNIVVSMNATFVFIGNNLAVDLINTEIIFDGELTDLLPNKTALSRWLTVVKLPIDNKHLTTRLHTDVLALRNAFKSAYAAQVSGLPASAKKLSTINKYLILHSTTQLLQCKSGQYTLQPTRKNLSPEMILGQLAHAGALLLASPQAQQLKCCENPDCVLTFVDTSRNKKRRWCSMEECGNRAKVATHYRKNIKGVGDK